MNLIVSSKHTHEVQAHEFLLRQAAPEFEVLNWQAVLEESYYSGVGTSRRNG
jgi:hypothetical protein